MRGGRASAEASPTLVYVLPGSGLHGGIRVVLEHAEGMARRGWAVTVVGPEPPPDWHPLAVPYRRVALDRPGSVPAADVCIGTFWTTVEAAVGSGSRHVFHFCQGWEGVHREYAPILPRVDAVYRLAIPKLLISAHLEPILAARYGCECHLLGPSIDSGLFSPGPPRPPAPSLRVGVVGPFGVRSKGIGEALAGLAQARAAGQRLEVWRASAEPLGAEERRVGVGDRFCHRLSTAEMVTFYRQLDALVFSSHDEEGFPLPPLEAMACGAAVALTRISPFEIVPADAALRFSAGDPASLVPALAALADPARRRPIAAAGLTWARSRTLDAVLDRLERALARHGAPGARREPARAP